MLLRPRQFQRRDEQDPRARARLRRLHVHAAQDLWRARRAAAARPSAPMAARAELAPFLPTPVVALRWRQLPPRPRPPDDSIGKVREFLGNVPQVVPRPMPGRAPWAPRASPRPPTFPCWPTTTWRRSCSKTPRRHALASRSVDAWRMEMTRFSLGQLFEDTGVTVVDVQNRMVDFGIDAFWLSPRALDRAAALHARGRRDVVEGGRRHLDRGAGARSVEEAYSDPEMVKIGAAQPGDPPDRPGAPLEDPERWAMTWRAYQRKRRRERCPAVGCAGPPP